MTIFPNSPSVRYEAAGTLITLSTAPTAVKAAASCYIDLIVKESDNNVKLIVLDRLIAMKESPSHEKILQELVMDILRVLSSPDLEVRRKTLGLAMDLVTSRNIDELVLVLKKVCKFDFARFYFTLMECQIIKSFEFFSTLIISAMSKNARIRS